MKLPELLTCGKCGARVRHLQLHLKRSHKIGDRATRKAIKEAAFAHELVSIIVGSGYDVSRRLDQGAAMTWSTYRPVCLIAAAML